MYIPFNQMPSHSRVWIFQSAQPLTPEQADSIQNDAIRFVNQWTSHDEALQASVDLRYSFFIIIAIDDRQVAPGGCSLDRCFQFIKELEKKYSLSLLNRLNVAYRDQGFVRVVAGNDFGRLVAEGKISSSATVFDNLVSTIEELNMRWDLPYRKSWVMSMV